MSKQAMRDETERLVKEALERKAITIKQGKTRIESKCAKCGALSRIIHKKIKRQGESSLAAASGQKEEAARWRPLARQAFKS